MFYSRVFYPKWKYFLIHGFVCLLLIMLHRKDKSTKSGERSEGKTCRTKIKQLLRKKFRKFMSLYITSTNTTINERNPIVTNKQTNNMIW